LDVIDLNIPLIIDANLDPFLRAHKPQGLHARLFAELAASVAYEHCRLKCIGPEEFRLEIGLCIESFQAPPLANIKICLYIT
jgi:hypothetical protein